MANYALLTANGKDRPGIVAAIARVLLESDCNIEDSQMARLGPDFACMLVLRMPEGLLGDQWDKVIRTYHQRYRYKHPDAQDFMNTVNEVSGRDMKWFFDQTVYGTVTEIRMSGWSNFNGISLEAEHRYSHGYGFQLSYTMGNALQAGGQQWNTPYTVRELNYFLPGAVPTDYDARNRFLNYRRDTDIPKHSVKWNWLVDLPFGKGKPLGRNAGRVLDKFIGGWQLGSIMSYQTGFPITVSTGTDIANTGGGFDRPNATGIDPVLPRSQQKTARFFNIDAFLRQPAGTFGNVGRNTLIGPRILNWDFSTHKDFPITETHRVEFRFEAFNFMNHPNWANPNTSRNSAGFGSIGGTRTSMRQLQFALKYVF